MELLPTRRPGPSWFWSRAPLLELGVALVGLLSVTLWWLHLAGRPAPLSLARLVLAATLGAILLAIARGVSRLWRGSERPFWSSSRLMLVFLVIAGAVRFIGIDHEVEERYYLDEGTYYRHASEINQGEVLRGRFVYPHLLYYLYAFVLWIASLFPTVVASGSALAFGVTEPLGVEWLLMRCVVATLSATTVIPVFRLGQWLGGSLAAALGSTLFIFSTLFNDGSHLLISDAPAAVFATWALWRTVRVVDTERPRDYAIAGVFAGLAAATKYPAGVVAIAIVATWLGLRVRKRNWTWGLLWAGLAALATFVAVMPSLLFFPRQAFTGGQGIFFGVRQYSGGGWLGVMPSNNFLYYLGQLRESFGLPILVLGALGLLLLLFHLPRSLELVRHRLPHLLTFPLAYALLIGSMNMVVKRNLYPIVPVLAVLLATGLAGLYLSLKDLALARSRKALSATATTIGSRALRGLAATMVVGALLLPVTSTVAQTVALARPGTRVLAREWIRDHVARGAFVVQESYTPVLSPAEYRTRQARFVPRLGLDWLRSEGVDVVMVSSSAYNRFFTQQAFAPHHETSREVYRRLFDDNEELADFQPSIFRTGPRVRIFRGGPLDAEARTELAVSASDLFVPDPRMRPPTQSEKAAQPREGSSEQGGFVRFFLDGQWCSATAHLAAGRYRVEIAGALDGEGTVEIESLERETRLEAPFVNGAALVTLPETNKYVVRVRLPIGAEVRALSVKKASDFQEGPAAARGLESALGSG